MSTGRLLIVVALCLTLGAAGLAAGAAREEPILSVAGTLAILGAPAARALRDYGAAPRVWLFGVAVVCGVLALTAVVAVLGG